MRMKFFIKKLIYNLKYYFDKSSFRIPGLAFDPHFKVQLATTKEDFEQALMLLNSDSISKSSLTDNARLLMFLPQSATVVVKYKNSIIATATLIQDSKLGFACENYYSNEIQTLRKHSRQQHIEIGHMAIDAGFKKSSLAILHLILKYAIRYTRKHLQLNGILIALPPVFEDYFSDKWNFKKIGPMVQPTSSAQSRLILLQLDLTDHDYVNLKKLTPSKKITENVALFVSKRDLRFIYPQLPFGQIIFPIMTPAMLEYFCIERTSLYAELSLKERQVFLEIYIQFYGFEAMKPFLNIESEIHIKEFRLPIQTQVSVRSGNEYFFGIMRDLSTTGCYFEMPRNSSIHNKKIFMTFKIGELELSVHGHTIWQNRAQNIRYREGYGVRFDNPLLQINDEVKTWSNRLHKIAS